MNDEKNLWQGGLWEQSSPEYPKAPPVVVPPPSAFGKTGMVVESQKLSLGAKLGFGSFLTLIVCIVGLSISLGVKNSGGSSLQDHFSEFFKEDGKKTSQIVDKVTLPPTIRSASYNEDVGLEFSDPLNKPLSTREIYEKCLPSIVLIEAKGFGVNATGTGVIMSEEGYIITNAHVIDGASEAWVTLWDNTVYDATLVGYDYVQDLAVLKIDGKGETFVAAEFSDSDLLQVGDPSYALGNPLGSEYRSTFTDGMVSAVDRILKVDQNSLVFVQTTAAINSGNSGGALINEFGQVVGITTIKIMSDDDTIEGMGFAIPSKRAKQVLERLMIGEAVIAPTIGIIVQSVQEPVKGLLVVDVGHDTVVYEEGMREGDIILEANGKTIETATDLNLVKGYLFVGDHIEYLLYRDGEEFFLVAELEE